MIKGIHHISMKCSTQEAYQKAKGFYCNTLGLTVFREWQEGILLDTGNGYVEIFCNGEGIPVKGAVRHFALLTDDADTLAAKIRAAGYEVFIEPNDIDIPSEPVYPIRMAFCTGPLGEEIELFQER
ncbi:MAG: VOC family protein [Oscillospiraceae bacterium]|nr:VOC family protein [Oscillospiraceae bacterium]